MDPNNMKKEFDRCIIHLKEEFAQIRTGRATPELVEPVKVEAYGTISPLKNLGNIAVSDAKSIVVQVWDKSIMEAIVKGVEAANLGFRASIEGDIVRISIPDLTEERRLDLVKVMKDRAETARIAVRNVRRDHMQEIEAKVKAGELSEDDGKRQKDEVEKMVKEKNEEIEEMKDIKEKDIMTV